MCKLCACAAGGGRVLLKPPLPWPAALVQGSHTWEEEETGREVAGEKEAREVEVTHRRR